MLDPSQIRAITLDLDDTLWPIWPTIARAEEVLLLWLKEHTPQTAQLFATPEALRAIRQQVQIDRPDLHNDLSALRQASIALALRQAGDDENLAIPAFEIFFAERQRVQLFDDALPALRALSARWPVLALTNGNANVHTVGVGEFFVGSLNVQNTGFAKPDVRMFACAAQTLGVAPQHIMHVGDDARMDAVGARSAGMHAVWLNRGGLDWPVNDQPQPWTVRSLDQLCAMLAV